MIEESIYSTKGKIRRKPRNLPKKGLFFNLRRKNVCDLRLRLRLVRKISGGNKWIDSEKKTRVLLTRDAAELYSIKIKVNILDQVHLEAFLTH